MCSKKIISIEGNIGSGKSTILEYLKIFYKDYKNILFLDEPVSQWNEVVDDNGVTILEKYYENPIKYAFPFQMMAYISRLSIIKKALLTDCDIIITERSIHTDYNVFAKMLYDTGKMNTIEYNIYMKWFNEFIVDIPKINIVYIDADYTISYERVIKRNRKGETILKEYLKNCQNYHIDWLDTYDDLLVIDANIDIDKHKYMVNIWINEIDNFIKMLK